MAQLTRASYAQSAKNMAMTPTANMRPRNEMQGPPKGRHRTSTTLGSKGTLTRAFPSSARSPLTGPRTLP